MGGGGNGQWVPIAQLPAGKRGTLAASFLRLDSKRLASPSYSQQAELRVDQDGGGLASFLAHMALNRPDDFRRLQVLVRDVIPSVERIRFDRVQIPVPDWDARGGPRPHWEHAIVFDMEGAANIPAHMVSDGTLLVLGLLAVLVGTDDGPRLVLPDDLGHGLHPKAQRDLRMGAAGRVLESVFGNAP
jgi:predicted ATPase